MKKQLAILLSILVMVVSSLGHLVSADELMDITRAAGYEVSEINRPKASIIVDGSTGSVLWEDNADVQRDPASMSKMMTLYLVYEAIAQGQLTEETVITATETDQAIAKIYAISNNNIVAGVDYTVGELITMTAVPSSNAATVMLANYLSDNDPDRFLDMMNEKAKELGMTNTVWNNASGAVAVAFEGYYSPKRYDNEATNQTTARDQAILVYHFVNNYPAILEHTDDVEVTVKAGTPYEETFHTYNYSLPGAKYGIEGVRGLKTGSSPSAAFNYMASVERGNQKVIAIIMGVGDWADQDGEYYRHPFGNALIEKAYADYEYRKVLPAGKQEIDGKTYQLSEDIYATVAKGETPKVTVNEAGEVVVETGLAALKEGIHKPVKAEVVKTSVVDAVTTAISEPGDKAWWELFEHFKWLLLILPLLVVVLLIVRVERRRRRRTAATRYRRRER